LLKTEESIGLILFPYLCPNLTTMSIHQITTEIHQQLASQYPDTEIESLARILFRHYLKMSPAQVQLSQGSELSTKIERQIHSAIYELKKYRPIQYIICETEFYGLCTRNL